MDWGTILFIIVMLHLLVGFGYAFYKIEFAGRKKKDKKPPTDQN